MPISLDPVCPCHLRILTAPPAHSCEARNLSWQCFSGVIAISWNPCLFRRFALTSPSLSFGVSFSYIRPYSLDILFSPHPILLTRFSLGAFFLYPFVLTYVCSLFLLNWFHLKPSVFPALLRATNLAQNIGTYQYYFVLQISHKALQYYFAAQSLHKVLPTTTSYYKACTKYFPVLLRTTLARSTWQYYFVLQSLHRVLPSTTSYYTCTKYFAVLLRTTKLAQSTSQYYFVLQSLHKVLPSTTGYKMLQNP